MPWRLILFLIALALFVLFAAFNAGNSTDISVVFYTFTKVPIFISLFLAFLLGALVVLPYSFRHGRRMRALGSTKAADKPKYKETENGNAQIPGESGDNDRIVSEAFEASKSTDRPSPKTKRQQKAEQRKRKQA
ncbi:MAG TPA: hypothetical protein VMW73_01085 [Spirochaetia bacterium]|nr:hypothetical protein [Spirochaetia bacterium]